MCKGFQSPGPLIKYLIYPYFIAFILSYPLIHLVGGYFLFMYTPSHSGIRENKNPYI